MRLAWKVRTVSPCRVGRELVKRLVGQRTSSHGGRYVYRRKGLLGEIPRVRLIRGVIIVRMEDAGRVERFLAASGADAYPLAVGLTPEDRRILGRRYISKNRSYERKVDI